MLSVDSVSETSDGRKWQLKLVGTEDECVSLQWHELLPAIEKAQGAIDFGVRVAQDVASGTIMFGNVYAVAGSAPTMHYTVGAVVKF